MLVWPLLVGPETHTFKYLSTFLRYETAGFSHLSHTTVGSGFMGIADLTSLTLCSAYCFYACAERRAVRLDFYDWMFPNDTANNFLARHTIVWSW